MELLECPYCGKNDIKHGSSVCNGCQAQIMYGITPAEYKVATNKSALVTIAALGIIPVLGYLSNAGLDSIIGGLAMMWAAYMLFSKGYIKPYNKFLKNLDTEKVTFFR